MQPADLTGDTDLGSQQLRETEHQLGLVTLDEALDELAGLTRAAVGDLVVGQSRG